MRTSVVLTRVASKDEVFDFIRKWKTAEPLFNGHTIHARADKPPEQRKANAKVFKITAALREVFIDKDIDPDYKNHSVWLGDFEVVKWDMEGETYFWLDEGIAGAGVQVDRQDIEKRAEAV